MTELNKLSGRSLSDQLSMPFFMLGAIGSHKKIKADFTRFLCLLLFQKITLAAGKKTDLKSKSGFLESYK